MKKVEVIYIGERANPIFGKIYQTFKDKKGNLYQYQGLSGIWPGSCYWTFNDGKIKKRPESVENPKLEFTEQDKLDLEAHKEICKQVRLERKKKMEVKKPHPDIVRAINLLRPFARNLGPTDLHRFASYLQEQLGKKGKS